MAKNDGRVILALFMLLMAFAIAYVASNLITPGQCPACLPVQVVTSKDAGQ
jgi:hypothetical protein